MLTNHAATRSKQRAIPNFVVDLILDHGARVRRNGADIVFLDKRARNNLRRELGARILARIEDQLDVYVVEEDGVVITVGHRLNKIWM